MDNVFSRLIKDAQPWFSQHSTLIDWGPSVPELSKKELLLPTITVFAEVSLAAPVTRLLLVPKLTDQACNTRDIVECPPTTTANGIKIGTSKEGILAFHFFVSFVFYFIFYILLFSFILLIYKELR